MHMHVLVLPALACCVVAPGAAGAPMPLVTSLPDTVGSPVTYLDDPGDAGAAPDLTAAALVTDDTGGLVAAIEVGSTALTPDDAVVTLIDVDGDGNALGAAGDMAVVVGGTAEGGWNIGALRWNGAAYDPAQVPSLTGRVPTDRILVWRAALAELGIPRGRTVGVRFQSLRLSAYGNESDFAPRVDAPPFRFAVPRTAPVIASFGPLRIQGLVVRRFGANVRVRFGWTGAAGARTSWRIRLRAAGATRTFRGTTRPGATVARRVAVPAAWAGRPVQVRVTLTSGRRTVTVTRTVR